VAADDSSERLARTAWGLASRRGAITGGLAAALSWLAPADAETLPPVFTSGKHQFTLVSPQRMLPSIRLFSLAGGTFDLASLRGEPILLNFWASWCPACRIELPVLDRLSERARKMRLNVVAVSEDRGGRDQVGRFVQSLGIRNLPIYLDPHGYVGHTDPDRTKAPFALYGMPITYLIASSGRIVGYMPGAADWTEPAAGALVEYLRNA
jgi:thiol-disulfide isomerase/thioredoxin